MSKSDDEKEEFTPSEVAYLRSLPAVANVSKRRISYSEAFKRSVARRYIAGESPVRIFRSAGLDPVMIGYKRIERSISRWKEAYAPRSGEANESEADDEFGVEAGNLSIAFAKLGRDNDGIDIRDVLIYQQVRRVAELEDRIAHLQAQVRQLNEELEQCRAADAKA